MVQGGTREEEIVESDTEDEEIIEEWDAIPLRIRIPGARAPVLFEVDLQQKQFRTINPGMWLSMVNIKLPHLADLEVDNMKKFIFD